jgi:hypothetical protein
MTAVVRGATLIAMPIPRMATAGKNVAQYVPPTPGLRKRTYPNAATVEPMVSGIRVPYRATNPPDQRESIKINKINGNKADPASVAE